VDTKHRTPTCKCGWAAVNYSIEFDAHYCPLCGEWVDHVCADPDCAFCKDRPEKPLREWYTKTGPRLNDHPLACTSGCE